MDYATFGILLLTGFTACAEFGSYAFVHPIIRELPEKYHIQVERGLLRTFGRVMPVLMTLCAIVAVSYALHYIGANDYASLTRWIAATFFAAALNFTIIFNVPINLATGKWNPDNPPPNWKETRNKWKDSRPSDHVLLLGFASICVAVSLED